MDVIAELQSLFPARQDDEFLLWSHFEEALTQYDKNAVEGWALDSLYVAIEESGGREIFTSGDVLDTAIIDIVQKYFSTWVNDIEVSGMRIFDFDSSAKFITFNYTETLERLYCKDIVELNLEKKYGTGTISAISQDLQKNLPG